MMIPNIPTVSEFRQLVETVKKEKYRYAFMYQFLIGGEVDEICGKYSPKKMNMRQVSLQIRDKSYPALLFVIKNIRPQLKGEYRSCCIPLDSEIEPWAYQIRDWFLKSDEYPFVYSPRAYQNVAEKTFMGLSWPKEKYLRAPGEKVKRRHNPFRAGDIRELRRKNLVESYYFGGIDLALFGAWNEPVSDVQIKSEIEKILSTKIHIEDYAYLIKRAEKYFEKLLRPYWFIEKEITPANLQIRDYVDTSNRYQLASEIVSLVKDINLQCRFKLSQNIEFFKENMWLPIEVINPCESKEQFTTKLLTLNTLFEVDEKPLRELINEEIEGRSISVTEQWLKEKNIKYEPEMIETWLNIRTLRNKLFPIHSETDPILMQIMKYFGELMKLPPNYHSLWDNILNKFRDSLREWLEILNLYTKE